MDPQLRRLSGLMLHPPSRKFFVTSSPISTVPPEVLSEMFLALVASAPLAERQVALASVCLVCHRWKWTAYSDPRLWTSLSVLLTHTDGMTLASPLPPWIAQFFGRAGELPLNLAISALHGTFSDEASLSCMGLVQDYHWDWSRLESLKLHFPIDIWSQCKSTLFAPGSMPRLVDLDLKASILFNWVHVFPWSQLVRLTIKTGCQLHVYNVLSQCRNLEEFSISFPSFDSFHKDRREPIHLPKLRKLALNFADLLGEAVFEPLHAPCLESLAINLFFPGGSITPTAFRSLTHDSGCKLRELSLEGVQISEEDYTHLLKDLGGLETLAISTHQVRSDFLCYGSIDSRFLPHLRNLKLNMGVAPCDVLQGAFDLFVSSRSQASSRAVSDGSAGCCQLPCIGTCAALISSSLDVYSISSSVDVSEELLSMFYAVD